MIVSKDIFLKRLVQLPELSSNILAFVFADNPDLDISSRENFFGNVISYFKRFKENKPDITQYKLEDTNDLLKSWEGKDLRIKNVKLKSVRGFPQAAKPFGIDFTNKNGEPQSMIILGGNATGKSSLYDAIEFSYCDSVGEALLRAYKEGADDDVRFMNFLEHNENGEVNIFCHVQTMSDKLDIQKHKDNIPKPIRDKINPDTHFVSDYDIYTKGQLDYEKNSQRSFHNIIAQSLGLTDLLEFEKNLTAFTIYRRQTETRNIGGLKKSNDNQQTLITNNEKAINEKKNILNQLKQQQSASPDDKKLKEVLELMNQTKQTVIQTTINSKQFASSIEQFNRAYTNLISKEIKNAGLNEIQFLNLGLELLKEHTDCPFCNSSKLLKDEVAISVNQRISKLKELNEVTQALNKAFNDVTDYIENLKNQIEVIKSRVTKELNSVKEKTEFNELFLLDNSFATETATLTAKEFLIQLFSLNENPNYLKDKNKFLFELFKSNAKFSETELNQFLTSLNSFNTKRTEIIQKVELEIAQNTQPKSLTEQIIGLNKEITDLERQSADARENIKRDTEKINEIQEQVSEFAEVKTIAAAFLKSYHNVLNEEINKSFAPIKMVVEEVLENYFRIDNREVDLIISKQPEEFDEETGEVLSEIITAQLKIKNQNIQLQPVNKYLNTFHFRLFSTMVGISIAIASRRNTQVNLPLVLDDVFYASDFENKTSIESFLKQVFNAFKTYTPDLPLQLILFTHDQLIFESAIKVIKEIEGTDIAFAKLFPHKEAQDEGDYMNLIYRFPDFFPHTIMNNLLSEL
jgi:predicted  nucleic acid-binding Zn-ribbon protein